MSDGPCDGGAAAWVAARAACHPVHLDAAACGRPSRAGLAAVLAHLQQEAERGGYVAEVAAEQDVLPAGRAALGRLLGLPGDHVAYADSGATAFADLLAAWPLPAGARVGTVPGEYAGNAAVLRRLAGERGWHLVPLPVDPLGRVTDVPPGLDLLTLPQVLSQRGVVQPVEQLRDSGVPLLLDVAQALGQAAVPAGCAGYVGTSRKWLCGPRGVGFLAVDPQLAGRLTPPPTMSTAVYDGLRRFEPLESHVAGRVGLAVAAQEWTADLLPVIHGLAGRLRHLLADLPGVAVVEPAGEPSGITTLRLPGDPGPVRAALLAQGWLTSVVPVQRAADVPAPLLRVSTPAWLAAADLDGFASALRALG